MATPEPLSSDRLDPFALPLSLASAWAGAVGEMTQASLRAWSDLAETCGQASAAYAALLGGAINLEGVEARGLADKADRLLRDELHGLEEGTEHLVHAAEEILVDLAGRRLVPLPD